MRLQTHAMHTRTYVRTCEVVPVCPSYSMCLLVTLQAERCASEALKAGQLAVEELQRGQSGAGQGGGGQLSLSQCHQLLSLVCSIRGGCMEDRAASDTAALKEAQQVLLTAARWEGRGRGQAGSSQVHVGSVGMYVHCTCVRTYVCGRECTCGSRLFTLYLRTLCTTPSHPHPSLPPSPPSLPSPSLPPSFLSPPTRYGEAAPSYPHVIQACRILWNVSSVARSTQKGRNSLVPLLLEVLDIVASLSSRRRRAVSPRKWGTSRELGRRERRGNEEVGLTTSHQFVFLIFPLCVTAVWCCSTV